MGFGGSVSAMIASMKANKRSRVSTFDKIKHLKKRNHIAVHFKNEATPKELKILKAKIQQNHHTFECFLFMISLNFSFQYFEFFWGGFVFKMYCYMISFF